MRKFVLLPALAAAAFGLAGTATAQQTAPGTQPAEANGAVVATKSEKPEKPKKPKKICREDAHAYSRMPTRTCKTAAQWAAEDDKTPTGTNDLKGRAIK